MKVTYNGPSSSGVDVIHADPEAPDANTVTHCPPGETVDLPDEIAVRQLATGVFDPGDKAAAAALRAHERAAARAAAAGDAPANPPEHDSTDAGDTGASEGSD